VQVHFAVLRPRLLPLYTFTQRHTAWLNQKSQEKEVVLPGAGPSVTVSVYLILGLVALQVRMSSVSNDVIFQIVAQLSWPYLEQ
jgi:hypothetical protein